MMCIFLHHHESDMPNKNGYQQNKIAGDQHQGNPYEQYLAKLPFDDY